MSFEPDTVESVPPPYNKMADSSAPESSASATASMTANSDNLGAGFLPAPGADGGDNIGVTASVTLPSELTPRTLVIILVMLAATSVIEFAAAADFCSNGLGGGDCSSSRNAWAIAVGVLSFLVVAARLYIWKRHPDADKRVDTWVAGALVVLWVFGAAFNTSSTGPMSGVTNGYFATWIAFFGSIYYASLALSDASSRLRDRFSFTSPLTVLMTASIILLSTAADQCGAIGVCDGKGAFAVASGCISAALCLLQILLNHQGQGVGAAKIISIFLAMLW
eukprot:UC1_evm1s563